MDYPIPPGGGYPIRPPIHRFLAKVRVTTGCWSWTGCTQSRGYGVFAITRTHNMLAHRFAYEALVGPIPDGMTIDHLCFNRRCVSPEHLEPVPLSINVKRANARRRALKESA